jgi:hypothetical protein
MSHLTQSRLLWRRLSADAYEANGTGHRYAVINIGNPSASWLATSSDRRYAPRPEQSELAAKRICEAWADLSHSTRVVSLAISMTVSR